MKICQANSIFLLLLLAGCINLKSIGGGHINSTPYQLAQIDCTNPEHLAADLKIRQVPAPIFETRELVYEEGIRLSDSDIAESLNFINGTAALLTGRCVSTLDNYQITARLRHGEAIVPNSPLYDGYKERLVNNGGAYDGLYPGQSAPRPANIEGRFVGANIIGWSNFGEYVYLGIWERDDESYIGAYSKNTAGQISHVVPLLTAKPKLLAFEEMSVLHGGAKGMIWLYQKSVSGVLMYNWVVDFDSFHEINSN